MIYLDHNATTPLHPEVAEVMKKFLDQNLSDSDKQDFGNPSSIHVSGRAARSHVEDARENLAKLLSVHPTEIIFTSGGTEANNLALFGAVASGKLSGKHLIVSAFEHPSVLEVFRKLEKENYEVTWILPNGDGIVEVETVEKALRPDTVLVSLMAANNEVGTVQPIEQVGQLLKSRGILFHCDAVQALGKIADVHPKKWNVDYLTVSAHKINGPKGMGALYLRKGAPMAGLNLGGSQERSFRGGTENILGILGFGKACEIAIRVKGDGGDGESNGDTKSGGKNERVALGQLRDDLQNLLKEKIPDMIVNAENVPRLPGTLHVTLPHSRGDLMVMSLDMQGIAVSAGSACASGSVKYSHVVLAMGKSKEAAACSLRFSLGMGNDHSQMAWVVDKVAQVAASVRDLGSAS